MLFNMEPILFHMKLMLLVIGITLFFRQVYYLFRYCMCGLHQHISITIADSKVF